MKLLRFVGGALFSIAFLSSAQAQQVQIKRLVCTHKSSFSETFGESRKRPRSDIFLYTNFDNNNPMFSYSYGERLDVDDLVNFHGTRIENGETIQGEVTFTTNKLRFQKIEYVPSDNGEFLKVYYEYSLDRYTGEFTRRKVVEDFDIDETAKKDAYSKFVLPFVFTDIVNLSHEWTSEPFWPVKHKYECKVDLSKRKF